MGHMIHRTCGYRLCYGYKYRSKFNVALNCFCEKKSRNACMQKSILGFLLLILSSNGRDSEQEMSLRDVDEPSLHMTAKSLNEGSAGGEDESSPSNSMIDRSTNSTQDKNGKQADEEIATRPRSASRSRRSGRSTSTKSKSLRSGSTSNKQLEEPENTVSASKRSMAENFGEYRSIRLSSSSRTDGSGSKRTKSDSKSKPVKIAYDPIEVDDENAAKTGKWQRVKASMKDGRLKKAAKYGLPLAGGAAVLGAAGLGAAGLAAAGVAAAGATAAGVAAACSGSKC